LKKAFTLTELVVIIGIAGLLLTVVIVGVQSSRAKGRDARRAADLTLIAEKISTYMYQYQAYPPDCGADITGDCEVNPSFDLFENAEFLAVPGVSEIKDYLEQNAAGTTYLYMCNRALGDPDCSQYILKACLETGGQSNSSIANEKAFKIENSVTGAIIPQEGPVCPSS